MTTAWAVIFPGQGSQAVGMLSDLAAAFPVVQETFAEASEVLKRDLWSLCQNGPVEELNLTEWTQPAMLAAGVAAWRVLKSKLSEPPQGLAGHSLGEYSALVAAEAISFPDAVALVAERAAAMQSAVPEGSGAMAALLGLDDAAVGALCAAQALDDVLEPVNFNSPGQVVIAGTAVAVERAIAAAPAAGARRAIKLSVSVPSHCALMRPAAARLAERLAQTSWQMPKIPVYHNVTAAPVATVAELRDILAEQLYRPVRWVDTIQAMHGKGVNRVVEAGPGKVLAGLNRRIVREMEIFDLSDRVGLEKILAQWTLSGAE